MTNGQKGRAPLQLEELQELLNNEGPFLRRDFEEVAESFVAGYGRFVRSGVPGSTIGLAMLGATINLYSMFEMENDLPDLLRALAEKIENKTPPN